VAKALQLVDETGGSVFGAACYQLKGDLLLIENAGNESEAQRCFRAAIQMARAQGAKTDELEAVTSLARTARQAGPA
jgi:predicted negative regulator of RcsB-dependent stress response